VSLKIIIGPTQRGVLYENTRSCGAELLKSSLEIFFKKFKRKIILEKQFGMFHGLFSFLTISKGWPLFFKRGP
jgi:hypothetical protein